MIIEIIQEKSNSNRCKAKIKYKLQCDVCKNKEFFKSKSYAEKDYHFCGKKCRIDATRKGGILNKKMRDKNLIKYGKEYTTQLETSKQKSKQTSLKNWGVENPGSAQQVIEKRKQTCLKRYGVENVFSLKAIREKANKTIKMRYGDGKEDIIIKMKQTNKERYGVECTLYAPHIMKQVKETIIVRYGVENVGQSEIVKDKIKKTMQERYGVNSTVEMKHVRKLAHSSNARKKAHQTMKKNKSYSVSKIEDKFYLTLLEYFNSNDVERFKLVNNIWPIDFYIKSVDTYIQFDGVYWHGLDRSLAEIKQFKSKRDVSIYKKYLTDRNQEKWFKENNMKLIRITDKEYIDGHYIQTLNKLKNNND